jgi:hypothetical protein
VLSVIVLVMSSKSELVKTGEVQPLHRHLFRQNNELKTTVHQKKILSYVNEPLSCDNHMTIKLMLERRCLILLPITYSLLAPEDSNYTSRNFSRNESRQTFLLEISQSVSSIRSTLVGEPSVGLHLYMNLGCRAVISAHDTVSFV